MCYHISCLNHDKFPFAHQWVSTPFLNTVLHNFCDIVETKDDSDLETPPIVVVTIEDG